MAETPPSGLSAAQAGHVLVTFRHVDSLLTQALSPLNRAAVEDSLTATHNDFSAGEAAALREAVSAVRVELEAGVRALDLPPSSEPISARWGAATAARLALVSVAELDARHLAAYGTMNEAAARRLTQVRARLEEKLEALSRLFDRA